MPLIVASFACGLIFGTGLLISGMTEPEKVLGFLDIFGAWDATLAFVMAGAVAVTAAGFAWARRRGAPVLAATTLWPSRNDIDAPLVEHGMEAHVTLVPVTVCKGLEFDHVVVVEPAVIASLPRGLNWLYVALTRAVSTLTVVYATPLPRELAA